MSRRSNPDRFPRDCSLSYNQTSPAQWLLVAALTGFLRHKRPPFRSPESRRHISLNFPLEETSTSDSRRLWSVQMSVTKRRRPFKDTSLASFKAGSLKTPCEERAFSFFNGGGVPKIAASGVRGRWSGMETAAASAFQSRGFLRTLNIKRDEDESQFKVKPSDFLVPGASCRTS